MNTDLATSESLSPIENLSHQLSNLLKQQKISQLENHPTSSPITVKLNDYNYSLWSRLVRIAIGGRGRLSHITRQPPPPTVDDPDYHKWEQHDLLVFSWIIQAIDADLVANFVEYSTAQDLWEGLAATYTSGGDGLQIFDLVTKSSRQQQGALTLEKFYSILQNYWREIDRRQPNPMSCPDDIAVFNRLKQDNRLFQFLAGVNIEYDSIKRDLLRESLLPSVETAYAAIRREAARLNILNPTEVGSGLTTRGKNNRPNGSQRSSPSDFAGGNTRLNSSSGKETTTPVCSHCGKPRHTRDGCFELIGYPDWWENRKTKNSGESSRSRNGKAAVATGSAIEISSVTSANGGSNGNEGAAAAMAASFGGFAAFGACPPREEKTRDDVNEDSGAGLQGFGKNSSKFSQSPSICNPCFFTPENFNILQSDPVSCRNSTSDPISSVFPNQSPINPSKPTSKSYIAQTNSENKSRWIFYCGATDTMTHDPSDFVTQSTPTKQFIQTANGDLASVQGGFCSNFCKS